MTVVCPGSFDPMTYGHLDIFERAAKLFDDVIVVVTINKSKRALFTPEERVALIEAEIPHLPNVRVDHWEGLLVDYTTQVGASAIVKGLRSSLDYEYELPMAQMNHHQTGVDTVFLMTAPRLGYISSSMAKEVALLGGDITGMVPDRIITAIEAKKTAA